MPRSLRTVLTASLLTLAVPGGALAATITVNPGEDPQTKVNTAADGDTVLFKAGAHSGTVTTNKNITIKGEAGSSLSAPATAEGATPTLAFTGAGGIVEGLTVVNQVTTGPAISGTAALTVRDLTALSAKGNGVVFGSGANVLQRSMIASLAPSGTAISADSPPLAAAKTLTMDSAVIVGKTALSASYGGPSIVGGNGVTVSGRHVTAIGDIVANSSTASVPGSAALAVTFFDSIIRGKRTATAGTGAAATIAAAETRNSVADTAADAAQLFVRAASFNFRLRADAPVINKGQTTDGESSTDLDGDPRVSGTASDYGADEFVNKAPTASLAAVTGAVRQGRAVTFDASKSSDPEGQTGGGIASYRWDFGDGSEPVVTTTPTTTRAFAERKDYAVTVTVTDKQGLVSAPSAPVGLTVIDGIAPTVTVGQPGVNQRLRLYRKGSKRRARVTFFGTAADDTGLSKVYLALRPVVATNGQCRWFDGKTRLVSASCTAPVLLTATLAGSAWRYRLPLRARLPRGVYELIAVAQDTSGLVGEAKLVALRFR